MNGGFNPLKGFLTEEDYDGVVDNMRLPTARLWPMPITLDVSPRTSPPSSKLGQDIALRDQEGVILATMTVTDAGSRTNPARPKRSLAPTTTRTRPSTTCTTTRARSTWAVR